MAMAVMVIIKGIQWLMTAATIYQFIVEESIQSVQMGIYICMQHNEYEEARKLLRYLESDLISGLWDFNRDWGWLAPHCSGAFRDFARATENSIKVYKELLGMS
ncbi:hypothetical protein DRZ78_00055 [Candidatus Aerophobetes bacterium]|uniref:Uncharacterized protein n=1 Tax=Aerophobetes bacterium TaxID=2030807 RepID=A0A662D2F7_UNCAE|nr:MAG: hypothetical protein DRZ78_00055 [Candidatus Aerophobetes bacterium]